MNTRALPRFFVALAVVWGPATVASAQRWIVSDQSSTGGAHHVYNYAQGSGVVTNTQNMPSGSMGGVCGVEYLNNRIYLLGISPNTLFQVIPNGISAGNASVTVIVPNAVASSPEGDLGYNPADGYMYAIENSGLTTNKKIFRIDLVALTSTQIGTFTADDPSGIAFDNQGNCIVVDLRSNTGGIPDLLRFDVMTNPSVAQFVSTASLGTPLGFTIGLDFDPDTNTPYVLSTQGTLYTINGYLTGSPSLAFVENVAGILSYVTGLARITTCTPPPPNMALWLPFDEPSGGIGAVTTNLIDGAGNGTLAGPASSYLGTPGKVARSVCFDQGQVNVPHYAALFLNGDYTIDAWIRPSPQAPPTWKYTIVDKRQFLGGTSWRGFWLYLDGALGRLTLEFSDGGAINATTTGPLVPLNQQWQHIAVTLRRDDGGANNAYVDFWRNGVQTGPEIFPGVGGQIGNTVPLRIGDDLPVNTDKWFLGCIDELEIFGRALSHAEIYRIFAAFEQGKCKNPCPADFDHNGVVDPADVAAFVNAWFASLQGGTLDGDFDGDGAVTPSDVAVFVGAWFTALTSGC